MRNPDAEKQSLRQVCLKQRGRISDTERTERDFLIQKRLTGLPEYQNAELVLCYVSIGFEVDTRRLIEFALKEGRTVAVPRCSETGYTLGFFRIGSLTQLKPGRLGILEPPYEPENEVKGGGRSLCVLPGLCFDVFGNRLGYGKGYYDRFLSGFRGFTAGLCPSAFLMKEPIPCGRFDRPVLSVVTEREILRFPPSNGRNS